MLFILQTMSLGRLSLFFEKDIWNISYITKTVKKQFTL